MAFISDGKFCYPTIFLVHSAAENNYISCLPEANNNYYFIKAFITMNIVRFLFIYNSYEFLIFFRWILKIYSFNNKSISMMSSYCIDIFASLKHGFHFDINKNLDENRNCNLDFS